METSNQGQLSSLEPIKIRALEQVSAFELEFLDRAIRLVDDSFSVIFSTQLSHEHTVQFLFEYFVFVFGELFVTLELADQVFEGERSTCQFELVHVRLVGFLLVQEF